MYKLLIGIVLGALVLGAGGWFMYTHLTATQDANKAGQDSTSTSGPGFSGLDGGTVQTPTETQPQTSGQTQIPGVTKTISLAIAGGGSIQVKNFGQNTDVVADPSNQGYFFIGNRYPDPRVASTDNPPFVIEFIQSTNYFNIAITAEPIGQNRLQMEQYLANVLGISKEQMCRLQYMVSVPGRVNLAYSGEDLRFSFCSGAVPLPL